MAAFADGLKITKSSNGSLETTNDRNGESNRTSLVSSLQKRHYGTVNKGQWKANGFLTHKLLETDTLQGIALKYSVPVAEIQRFNNLFSNDSIHLYTELKIPYCSSMNSSPSSSPIATKRNVDEQSNNNCQLPQNSSSDEEEVKRKPLSDVDDRNRGLTASGEKDIKSLLDNVDLQLKKSWDFAEKLAQKNSALKRDGYNRDAVDPEVPLRNEDDSDSIRYKVKRMFGKKTVWTPNGDSREQVEDEIFQL